MNLIIPTIDGIISAYRSIIPAIFKQSKDKNYFIDVKVPDTTI